MEDSIKQAFEEIDAGFFSGDAFLNREALTEAKEYIERWLREIPNCEDIITVQEELDNKKKKN